MRILLLLVSFLLLAFPSVRAAEEVEGYAFYPPGSSPLYGLIVRGSLVQKKVIINSATTATGPQPGTLMLTTAGQKLSLGDAKPASRLHVSFNVDLDKPGFHASSIDISIYYPFTVSKLPSIILKVAGTGFKKTGCRRKPHSPKVSEIFASIPLTPAVANKMHFGDSVLLSIYDESGALLEQSGFKICPEVGFKAMLSEAKKDLWNKTGGPNDGSL
ncbi:hypothetical protein BH10CYA1_BH10CYA1_05010 [soil metagenome]